MRKSGDHGKSGVWALICAAFAVALCMALLPATAFADERSAEEPNNGGPAVEQDVNNSVPDDTTTPASTVQSNELGDESDVKSDNSIKGVEEDDVTDGDDEGDASEEPTFTEGLVEDGAGLKYQLSDGTFLENAWKGIDGKRYYFGEDGYAYDDGWSTVGDDRYYFRSDGTCAKGGWLEIDDKLFYFSASGALYYGWVNWSDGTRSYFASSTSGAAAKEWWTIGGKRYYFDAETCRTYTGKKKVDGKTYYFNKSGDVHYGWVTWADNGTRSYFASTAKGAAAVGWWTIGGKRYYFKSDTLRTLRGKWKVTGKTYYFNKNGDARYGWVNWSGGTRSYFASTAKGAAAVGWWTIGGKRYYFKSDTLRTLRGKWKVAGKTYYFNSDGDAYMGWIQWADGTWSYFASTAKGAMAKGAWIIDGYRYTFDDNGKVSDRVITDKTRMIDKIRSYSSNSSWLIAVNKSTHKVGVFKGSKGAWVLQEYWSCVTGASGTRTPSGNYLTSGYKKTVLSTDSRARYCTQINGGIFFHTILASTSELGNSLSHGCIRLAVSNAKWIYNNIPSGTRVVIY